jgi:hypothetical protein
MPKEDIKLTHFEVVHLPLAFQRIEKVKIPPVEIENKLMIYNQKYKFHSHVSGGCSKPISKIVKPT